MKITLKGIIYLVNIRFFKGSNTSCYKRMKFCSNIFFDKQIFISLKPVFTNNPDTTEFEEAFAWKLGRGYTNSIGTGPRRDRTTQSICEC